MKILFSFILAAFWAGSVQAADLMPQFKALQKAASEQCHLPEKIHPYSAPSYNRFLSQVLIPEAKMLNTAFVTGFSQHISSYQPLANCIVVFMGLPNNAQWEAGFSFYNRAKKANALPELMFTGFDEDGALLLSPVPEGGVN